MPSTAPEAAIVTGNPLYAWLDDLKARFSAGERPDTVTGPFGTCGVVYGNEDSADEEYAVIGFCFPDDVYAEVDGLYGYSRMAGFRIFF